MIELMLSLTFMSLVGIAFFLFMIIGIICFVIQIILNIFDALKPTKNNKIQKKSKPQEIRYKYKLKDKNKIYELSKKKRIIYKITNSENNKAYIGKTINSFNDRYSGEFKSHNKNLQREINYYGIDKFTVEILESGLELERIDSVEKVYIKTGKNLYNIINN